MRMAHKLAQFKSPRIDWQLCYHLKAKRIDKLCKREDVFLEVIVERGKGGVMGHPWVQVVLYKGTVPVVLSAQ